MNDGSPDHAKSVGGTAVCRVLEQDEEFRTVGKMKGGELLLLAVNPERQTSDGRELHSSPTDVVDRHRLWLRERIESRRHPPASVDGVGLDLRKVLEQWMRVIRCADELAAIRHRDYRQTQRAERHFIRHFRSNRNRLSVVSQQVDTRRRRDGQFFTGPSKHPGTGGRARRQHNRQRSIRAKCGLSFRQRPDAHDDGRFARNVLLFPEPRLILPLILRLIDRWRLRPLLP